MSIDRGGLEYTITVDNQASAGLNKFEADVAEAQGAFDGLKATMADTSASVQGVRKLNNALTGLGNKSAQAKLAKVSTSLRTLKTDLAELDAQGAGLGTTIVALNSLKKVSSGIGNAGGFNKLIVGIEKLQKTNVASVAARFGALTVAITKFDRALASIAPRIATVAADIRAIGSIAGSAAVATARGVNQIQVVQARAQAQLQVNQARTASQLQVISARAAAGLGQTKTKVEELGTSSERSRGQVVRLLTAFAAFQAFRFSTDAFKSLVQTGIQFNAILERTQLDLAAIFSSTGQVKNGMGVVVQGAEAFQVAMGVASDQTKKLQLDAIRTVATFEQLLDAFKQGAAPGLAAGLDPDQLRQVVVLLTNAATSIGVEGDKLGEEIRSIIGGTATFNTRVAALLGGPKKFNEAAREAAAAGKTFEFLIKTFGNFGTLADRQAQTFSAAMGRVKESLQFVIGSGALPFFEAVKDTLNTIAHQLVDLKPDRVIPKPEAVRAFRGVSDGLAAVAAEVQKIIISLKASDVEAIAAGVAESFRLVAATIGPLLEGFVRGLNDVFKALLPIMQGFRQVAEQNRGLIVSLGRLAIIAKGLSLAGLGESIVRSEKGTVQLGATFTALAKQLGSLAGILAAVLIPLGAAQLIIQNMTGVTLSLSETVQGLGLTFTILAKKVEEFVDIGINFFEFLFDQAGSFAEQFVNNLKVNWLLAVGVMATALKDALSFAGVLDPASIEQAEVEIKKLTDSIEGLQKRNAELTNQQDKGFAGFVKKSMADSERLRIEITALEEQISELFAKAEKEKNSLLFGTDFGAALAKLLKDLKETVAKGMEEGAKEGSDAINEDGSVGAKDLGTAFQRAIDEAFKDVADTSKAIFDGTIDVLKGVVSEFGSFVADTIVDALDPTSDVDLVERFRQFLKAILKLIIETFVQIAVSKAILSGLGSAAGGGVGGFVTNAEGGLIPSSGRASPAHFGPRARGFSLGGRPRGIPASDTVPAWLTPKEYVLRREAVSKAGLRFVEMLNRGLISPVVTRALAGGGGAPAITQPRVPAFAGGGRVSASQITSARASTQGPTMAVIVGGPAMAQALYRAGRQGFLRAFREDDRAVRDSIGVR